jgi:hypothetical protein
LEPAALGVADEQSQMGKIMSLIPVAQAGVADPNLGSVRFVMKDGGKMVTVLVSNPALETIEIAPQDHDGHFCAFKRYRKSFERIASKKYDKGTVELDGSVCIRAMDMSLASVN